MTKRCPITYLTINDNLQYHPQGLKLLSPQLKTLNPLPFTARELRSEALKRSEKMSIQGVQYKLSAKLNIKHSCFEFTDVSGKYILKPQSDVYPYLPENEDLSMRLARTLDIEVPIHGMVYNIDNDLTYFIKRFDRVGHKDKIAVEDFAQLSGLSRDTKYDFTMERLIPIIEQFCTFPQLEKNKLLVRTVFNFIIGNEDMHLKNFSLITRDRKIELAPAYDFINSTLALSHSKEQIALPLNGKKNNLKYKDFIDYFAYDKLNLNVKTVKNFLNLLSLKTAQWDPIIKNSFLPDDLKNGYHKILHERLKIFLASIKS